MLQTKHAEQDNMATFGQMIREARKHRGWTRPMIAKHLGIKVTSYDNWESENRRPSYKLASRLVHLLWDNQKQQVQFWLAIGFKTEDLGPALVEDKRAVTRMEKINHDSPPSVGQRLQGKAIPCFLRKNFRGKLSAYERFVEQNNSALLGKELGIQINTLEEPLRHFIPLYASNCPANHRLTRLHWYYIAQNDLTVLADRTTGDSIIITCPDHRNHGKLFIIIGTDGLPEFLSRNELKAYSNYEFLGSVLAIIPFPRIEIE